MRRLIVVLFALAAGAAHAQTTALPDSRNFVAPGSACLTYAQMEAAKADKTLVPNVDWNAGLYAEPAGFGPNRGSALFSWKVPNKPQVWGFLHVGCGQMAGGVPAVGTAPKLLSTVNSILTTIKVSYQAKGDVNVLGDTFLYKSAVRPATWQAEQDARTMELGLLFSLAKSQRAWFMQQPCIGKCSWTDPQGRLWLTRVAGLGGKLPPYAMFVPPEGVEYLTGTFDLKDHLDYLTGRGFPQAASSYYYGTTTGFEPVTFGGAGTVDLTVSVE